MAISPETFDAFIKSIMRVLISIVVLVVAFYIILSGHYSDDVQKWAYGLVGTVIGYWIK